MTDVIVDTVDTTTRQSDWDAAMRYAQIRGHVEHRSSDSFYSELCDLMEDHQFQDADGSFNAEGRKYRDEIRRHYNLT